MRQTARSRQLVRGRVQAETERSPPGPSRSRKNVCQRGVRRDLASQHHRDGHAARQREGNRRPADRRRPSPSGVLLAPRRSGTRIRPPRRAAALLWSSAGKPARHPFAGVLGPLPVGSVGPVAPPRVDDGLATWLILPVVICLSQRLSHACLSTGLSKAKPRMAH